MTIHSPDNASAEVLNDADGSHGRIPSRRLDLFQWLLIAVGSAVLLAGVLNSTPLRSANDRSRWATVWALVERGTYHIDAIDSVSTWSTIDKVLHDGHLHSSKPPLQSTIAAGVYWLLKKTTGLDLFADTDITTRIILLAMNWLPAVLAFIVMARILNRLTDNSAARYIPLAALCFGTLVTGYSTTFNNHSTGAVCLVFALSPLLTIANNDSPRGWHYATTGFWAAMTCCMELPAALFGVFTFAVLVRKSVRLTAIWYVPAALIPLAAYFITNYLATGGVKPFYLYYGTEKYLYEINGIPSYWHTPHGMDQNLDSPASYLLHCTIGHHGVFSLTPVFLMSLLTWLRPAWWKQSPGRMAILCGGVMTAIVLGFYLTRTQNYNYGGNTFGLRWMIWLAPFMVVAMVPALERMTRRVMGTAFAILLLVVSIFSAVSAAENPWASSWLFNRMEQAGWIDYSDPRPEFPFQRRLQTWFPELPGVAGAWVEFQSDASGSDPARRRRDTLRLTSRGREERDGTTVETIAIDFNTGRADRWSVLATFNTGAFYEGLPVDKQLMDVESSGPNELVRGDVITLLRGLPLNRDYRPGTVRHLTTRVRENAFRCQRAASQVTRKESDGVTIRYRSDLWLCDEIPFGTAQIELTELDHRLGTTLTRRCFTVSGFGVPSVKVEATANSQSEVAP